jgi:hypothetical protein
LTLTRVPLALGARPRNPALSAAVAAAAERVPPGTVPGPKRVGTPLAVVGVCERGYG